MPAVSDYKSDEPCVKCGGTQRYIKSNRCVQCNRVSHHLYDTSVKGRQKKRSYNTSVKGRQQSHSYNTSDKGRHRRRSFSYKTYGTTPELAEKLRFLQHNVCQICGAPDPTNLDHNHETKIPRAWLCRGCNLGLGGFRDNPKILRRAADYVEFFNNLQQHPAQK